MGFFTFAPLPTFEAAISHPDFDEAKFYNVLTTIIGCNLVYCDETQVFCEERMLPSLALAAAQSRYVLGEVPGEIYIDSAMQMIPDTLGRCQFTTLINPIPSKILVAAVQPDIDHGKAWMEIERQCSEKGSLLDESEVLDIFESPDVKIKCRRWNEVWSCMEKPVRFDVLIMLIGGYFAFIIPIWCGKCAKFAFLSLAAFELGFIFLLALLVCLDDRLFPVHNTEETGGLIVQ